MFWEPKQTQKVPLVLIIHMNAKIKLLSCSGKCSETIFEDMREPPKKPLHLKGQMKYVPQWDSLIFLGTPM